MIEKIARSMVGLEAAAEMLGSDWSVRDLVSAIHNGEIPGYVRIPFQRQFDPNECDDDGDYEAYEIARIATIYSRGSRFQVEYITVPATDETGVWEQNFHADDPDRDNREFDYLARLPGNADIVCEEQICLINYDIVSFMLGEKTPEKYVLQLKREGEEMAVIAVLLKDRYPHLNGYDCMKLLDRERVEAWEKSDAKQGRPKQWLYDYMKKGKELLGKRKK